MLKRASSVPSRVALDAAGKVAADHHHHHNQQSSGISPSTTDESVKCQMPSTEQLLTRQSMGQSTTSRPTSGTGPSELLPNLPNITPVRGHPSYQGWL